MTQTIFPPNSPGNNWAYWRVENIADLPEATKRRRNRFSFIPTFKALEAFGPATCVHCGAVITTDDSGTNADGSRRYREDSRKWAAHDLTDTASKGVYGDYNPKSRMARLWHYECGWTATLNDVFLHNMTAVETARSCKHSALGLDKRSSHVYITSYADARSQVDEGSEPPDGR